MTSINLDFPWPEGYDQEPLLSTTEKVAAFDQIQHILAKLNIIDTPQRNFRGPHRERWQGDAAPLKTGYLYWPYTSTKPSIQPNTDNCIELDTTNPFFSMNNTKPSDITTEFYPELRTQDVNEPPVPLAADDLDYIENMEASIHRSVSNIARALRIIEPEIAVLRDLEDNLSFTQYGRRYKGCGGTCNSNNAAHANANDVRTSNHSDPNLLAPLVQYQPPPDNNLSWPSTDPTGTKYCTISKPLGTILRPSDGQFHNTGRCDKHADENEFNGIMLGHTSREGQYVASTHAWKCSGEPTRRLGREMIQRF